MNTFSALRSFPTPAVQVPQETFPQAVDPEAARQMELNRRMEPYRQAAMSILMSPARGVGLAAGAVGGLAQRVMGTVQSPGQAVGNAVETAWIDPRRPDLEQAQNVALNWGPMGMGQIDNLYHGSPYKFDKFKSEAIGTGEGAQAFGHGIYLSDSPVVAKEYQLHNTSKAIPKTFKSKNVVYKMGSNAEEWYFNAGNKWIPTTRENAIRAWSEINRGGALYTTTAFPGRQETLLKWDEPVDEKLLNKISDELSLNRDNVYKSLIEKGGKSGNTGQGLYKWLSNNFGGEKEASAWLKKAGIDGIEYPAGSLSGVKDSKAKNYVIFDPADIRIDAVNGVPVGDKLAMENKYTYRAIDENKFLVERNGNKIGIYHSAEQARNIIRNAEKLDKRYSKSVVSVPAKGGAPANSVDIPEKTLKSFQDEIDKFIKNPIELKKNERLSVKYNSFPSSNDILLNEKGNIKHFIFESQGIRTHKFVAYDGDFPVSAINISESMKYPERSFPPDMQAKLHTMYTKEGYRNKGYSSDLLLEAMKYFNGGLSPDVWNSKSAFETYKKAIKKAK